MISCLCDVTYEPKTLNDVFEDYDAFKAAFRSTPFGYILPDPETGIDYLELAYALVSARYGSSHISSDNEDQWKHRFFSVMFQYAPTWAKELEIQDKTRALTEAEILTGSKTINDHAYNPSTVIEAGPNPDSGEIETVNEQTRTKFTRGKLEGYANLLALLKVDVSESFVDKFKRLFRVILAPKYKEED